MFKHLALAGLLALAAASSQAAERYDIDPRHTQVQFTYSHFGFSNITGRFDAIEGEFHFDAADPTRSRISVTIPIASVSTGVDKLDAHLQAADFFDGATFPTATFASTGVTAAGEGKLKVAGDLTIHGVTKPVVLDVTVNKVGDRNGTPAAGFDATTTIKRSEFGVGKYAPAVSDEVSIRITLEATIAKTE